MTADVETETKQNVLTVPIQSVTTRAAKTETKQPAAEGEQGGAVAANNAKAAPPAPEARKAAHCVRHLPACRKV